MLVDGIIVLRRVGNKKRIGIDSLLLLLSRTVGTYTHVDTSISLNKKHAGLGLERDSPRSGDEKSHQKRENLWLPSSGSSPGGAIE